MFRFLHNLVHVENRFDEIKVCFPIRGHSFMETDKNIVGIIDQKSKVELPRQWADVFRPARVEPSPFTVVEVDQDRFRKWTGHLSKLYAIKCPLKTRPIRDMRTVKSHPRCIYHRDSYNGHFDSAIATNQHQKQKQNL